jgi:hypothetical protein
MLANAYFLGRCSALQAAGFSKRAAERLNASALTDARIQQIGEDVGIDWSKVSFTPDALRQGILVEYEHSEDPETNVLDFDLEATAKTAWAHLKEDKGYYTKLKAMEKKSDEEKGPFTPVDAGKTRGWLKSLGTSPEDAQVHDYAEEQGYNVHQLESVIYNLAHQHVTEK